MDEVAPRVLEGTTPADPIVGVVAALDTATLTTTFFGGTTYNTYGSYGFGTLDTFDDTIEPEFDLSTQIDLFPDETLWFDMWDEDLVDDDYIGSVVLKLEDPRSVRRSPR